MRLFIAEKPELGRAIAAGIGGNWQKTKSYMQNGDDVITWCFGHMLELADPEDYDPKYKAWRMEDLPFANLPVKYKVPSDKREQVKAIKDLVERSTTIVNAGDPDEEGQLLIDELLRYFGNTKPVMRVLINDNTPAVVRQALANLKPNADYENWGYKAEARRISDQLFGYNLTRAYTLQNKASGADKTITIGRVQTPILGMVVRRDRENAAHTKSYYYNIVGNMQIQDFAFNAKYLPTPNDPIDDKHRLIDKGFADDIASSVKGRQASVIKAETHHKNTPPPLPYNLLKLQQDCSKKWRYKPDEVMKITQSLREKHQLITYNRSDCQYLSDEQHSDAVGVLAAVAKTLSNARQIVDAADVKIKGKAFDSSKVTAHHAIVPTQAVANWGDLTEKEQNVYRLIAERYILQFYPNYEYDETRLVIEIGTHHFAITAHMTTAMGFKLAFNNPEEEDDEDKDEIVQLDLRSISVGALGQCINAKTTQHETKPAPLYTISTLMGDLARAAKYVKDPELAKLLKEKDKDKDGEHGGIGTSATRSAIIEGLFKRGYIIEKGKNVVSTKLGQDLYDFAADIVKYPDMSAIWFERQKVIRTMADTYKFCELVMKDVVNGEVERLKTTSFSAGELHPCPKCNRPLRRRTGQYGVYWSCSGFNDELNPCNHTMNDKGGKPVEKPAKKSADITNYECGVCGSKLIRRTFVSKKTKKPYASYTCSAYPKCDKTYWEKDGKPDIEN